jgi:importin subunit beta-1
MNLVLSALLTNINENNPIDLIRMAVKAFARAAPITNRNFQDQAQREYIMNALFIATKMNDEDTLEYLMQSFVDIARVNYDYLEDYLQQLGEMTFELISSDKEKVATLSIEFWTSICEVEIERNRQN